MKTILTVLFSSLFLSFTASSQSSECLDKIKTGKFKYMASGAVIEVTRTKTKQIETFNNGKSKVISKIKWISDTECILTFEKEINAPGCLKKGDKMKMTILECDGNEYLVSVTSENCGNVEITVIIIGSGSK